MVIYAENPEKTANPKFYADRELNEQDGQQLSDVIRYAINSEKTQEMGSEDGAPLHRFVSGINCSPATARDEMLAVKKRFGKEDGTVAYHGYQSFAPGEATPELAHEIGVKLATRLWGDRYQVIVATHLDKENHLHNHFVVNTVSFADGIKYHRTRKDYHEMQTVSDELCREYGLSVIEQPQQGRGKQYGECGNKMKTYDASGNLKAEGTFSFTHEKPEDGVLGELITSIPTIGGNYDDNGQSVGSNKFWLLTLDENYITIYHPGKYSGGVDWDDSGWYAYFKTEAETDSE